MSDDGSFFDKMKDFISTTLEKVQDKIKGNDIKDRKKKKDEDEDDEDEDEKDEKDEKKKEDKKKKSRDKDDEEEPYEDTTATDSPINPENILNKLWINFRTFVLPILFAVIVANDMIIYPVPIRIIFFVFTAALIYLNDIAAFVIVTYYILKALYRSNKNKNSENKERIFPKIFGILPILKFCKPIDENKVENGVSNNKNNKNNKYNKNILVMKG